MHLTFGGGKMNAKLMDSFPDFKTCSVVENGCEVRYQVDKLVTGDEDLIIVHLDTNQSDVRTLQRNPGRFSLFLSLSLPPSLPPSL